MLGRIYGMGKFMAHESLAQGLFNSSYNGAPPYLSVWEGEMQNTEQVLELMCKRMEGDWVSLNPKFRKCYGSKDIDAWTQIVW